MGLFSHSNVPKEIFNHTEIVLDDFSNNIDLLDCDGVCSINTLLTLIGFFSYYIAGTTKSKYATQVIDLFCDKFISTDSHSDAKELIQEYYFRAKRISDALMNSNQSLGNILDAHSESLCILNNWEVTDNNKTIIISVLGNYYQYLLGIK